MLWQCDHDSLGAQDAGFFARYQIDGRAQPFRVVERDIGNHRDRGLDNIGRIQPAAHAHFHHRCMHLAGSKIQKAHSGEGLEKTRQSRQPLVPYQALGDFLDMGEEGGKIIVANHGAIQLDALIHAAQVRRSVETGPVAGSREDTCQGRCGRPFAIGTRHQDRGERTLGVAQRCHERAHVRQLKFPARRAGRSVQFLTESMQTVKGRGIGHVLILE